MATVTLTAMNGRPLKINPNHVRQVFGKGRVVVYLTSGLDVMVRESRNEALDKITAPKRR